MAACQAVFGTYELVEAILAQLPPFEVGTAMAVCTTWREVVRQSSILPPINPILPVPETNPQSTSMMYPRGTNLITNPALPEQLLRSSDYIWSRESGMVPYCVYSFRFVAFRQIEGLRAVARAGEFATLPPVVCIAFQYSDSALAHWQDPVKAAFYTQGGVRLGDIEAVVRKIWAAGGVDIRARLEVVGTIEGGDHLLMP